MTSLWNISGNAPPRKRLDANGSSLEKRTTASPPPRSRKKRRTVRLNGIFPTDGERNTLIRIHGYGGGPAAATRPTTMNVWTFFQGVRHVVFDHLRVVGGPSHSGRRRRKPCRPLDGGRPLFRRYDCRTPCDGKQGVAAFRHSEKLAGCVLRGRTARHFSLAARRPA